MPSVIFISNYYTHHQHPFSQAMYRLCEGKYTFIETETMEEGIAQGWSMNKPAYVIESEYVQKNIAEIQARIMQSDLVIWGSAPYSMVYPRLKSGKITFLYSERIYKKECKFYKLPLHIARLYPKLGKYPNLYLLCASAYAATDYARVFCFRGWAYKWGYFPELKRYEDIYSIIESKHPASILWVARLIEWKHPEVPILIAKKLKEEGYQFQMTLIGTGELEDMVRTLIQKYGLCDCVTLMGAMSPNEVRQHMEKTQIFLFTSDRNEGWGAVLNESMNSGCAVVASHAIGAVPYLIENRKNGLIYQDGDIESAYLLIKRLLDDSKFCEQLGIAAYHTLLHQWNAGIAAERVLALHDHLSANGHGSPFAYGVCSEAENIKDDWFQG